jgi:hypothetical protein
VTTAATAPVERPAASNAARTAFHAARDRPAGLRHNTLRRAPEIVIELNEVES